MAGDVCRRALCTAVAALVGMRILLLHSRVAAELWTRQLRVRCGTCSTMDLVKTDLLGRST